VSYVDIAGHPTWVTRTGAGEPLLLLHGGASCSDDVLGFLGPPLGERYEVIAFDRRGHGYTADTAEPFHYESMADEVIGVLETVIGGPAVVVGWSDGGIASLLAARKRPDLVRRQVLIGANFHHDGIVLNGVDDDPDFAAYVAQAYAERSPDGAEHFPVVMEKFLAMARTEPTLTADDLGGIGVPTLVLAGDDDLVRLDHTAALYEALPEAQLAILPGASHAVPVERPAEVAAAIIGFLDRPVPPPTAMPVRRRA
jgi:pimeloyl-ACP methyl ester carboxylesterase